MARRKAERLIMSTRRSIAIDGLSHLTAIPVASKVGPLLASSVIVGFEPGTRNLPEGADAQLANIFGHIKAMLDEAGGTWGDVAKLDFWAPDAEMRKAIDAPYVEVFPDEASRPARHTHSANGKFIRASFLAYIDT